MKKTKKRSHRTPKCSKKECLSEIVDILCDQLDDLALKQELSQNEALRKIRPENPDLADEIEKAFSCLRTDGQFGSSQAAYIKSEIIRPIQRRHIKK